MSNTAPTLGPWFKVRASPTECVITAKKSYVIHGILGGPLTLATVYGTEDGVADFIAAAPETAAELERVKAILAELITYIGPCPKCDGSGHEDGTNDDACHYCGGYGELLRDAAIESAVQARAILAKGSNSGPNLIKVYPRYSNIDTVRVDLPPSQD